MGDTVREGDVLAVLDDTDYRLAVEAASQQLVAATTQARQAESDRHRLDALKLDGSVSESDDERAQSGARTAAAAEAAQARALELARNRLKYTVLRASRSGVVTSLRFEVGQVVAEGQPIISIANPGEPEIAVDVPEDHLAAFKASRFQASLASAPDEMFEVVLRELSPQAAAQTRTYRARLKPKTPRAMPLGATATLVVARQGRGSRSQRSRRARSRRAGGQPALWVVRHAGTEPVGKVDLVRVAVHGYRNDEVLVSGPPAGELVVTAGVQKMSPGLRVALPAPSRTPVTLRPQNEKLQSLRMGAESPRHRAVPDPGDRRRRRAGIHQARSARRPELLGPVDDGDRHVARRDGATGPGRVAQPHGEEVRAARPLREGQDLCAPGLRRHADHRRGRHLARGSAGGVVPGAQEVQRHQARASRRRRRPDLQRRIRRRDRAAVCRQGRRRQPRGAFRRLRGHQAPAAEGADGEESRRLSASRPRRSTSSSRTSGWPRSASRRWRSPKASGTRTASWPAARSTRAATA